MPEPNEPTGEPVPLASVLPEVLARISEQTLLHREQAAGEPAKSLYRATRLIREHMARVSRDQAEFSQEPEKGSFERALDACLDAACFRGDAQAVTALAMCVHEDFASIPQAMEGNVFAQKIVKEAMAHAGDYLKAMGFRALVEGDAVVREDLADDPRDVAELREYIHRLRDAVAQQFMIDEQSHAPGATEERSVG